MKMNAKNTNSMIITKKEYKPTINISIDGTEIEQVAHFPYLAQSMTEDGRWEEEIKRRIHIANRTFSKMSKVLTSKKIPLVTRERIQQMLCIVNLTEWSRDVDNHRHHGKETSGT